MVTNNFVNNVNLLKASDGTLADTYPVSSAADGITYDGTNMWVTNYWTNNVSKISAP